MTLLAEDWVDDVESLRETLESSSVLEARLPAAAFHAITKAMRRTERHR